MTGITVLLNRRRRSLQVTDVFRPTSTVSNRAQSEYCAHAVFSLPEDINVQIDRSTNLRLIYPTNLRIEWWGLYECGLGRSS